MLLRWNLIGWPIRWYRNMWLRRSLRCRAHEIRGIFLEPPRGDPCGYRRASVAGASSDGGGGGDRSAARDVDHQPSAVAEGGVGTGEYFSDHPEPGAVWISDTDSVSRRDWRAHGDHCAGAVRAAADFEEYVCWAGGRGSGGD